MTDVVDLYSRDAAYDFRAGDPIRLRMRPDGTLRPETWRDRWASAIAETLWPSGTFVVTHADHERGVITVGRR